MPLITLLRIRMLQGCIVACWPSPGHPLAVLLAVRWPVVGPPAARGTVSPPFVQMHHTFH